MRKKSKKIRNQLENITETYNYLQTVLEETDATHEALKNQAAVIGEI